MRFPDKDRPVVYGTNEVIKMKYYNGKKLSDNKYSDWTVVLAVKF